MHKIYPGQIKGARALLGMSQRELCDRAGVSLVTLRRLESLGEYPDMVSVETSHRIVAALSAAGVDFLAPGDGARGPGIALAVPPTQT
jgi:transcriptional regulator with XRE-family HTH domain